MPLVNINYLSHKKIIFADIKASDRLDPAIYLYLSLYPVFHKTSIWIRHYFLFLLMILYSYMLMIKKYYLCIGCP